MGLRFQGIRFGSKELSLFHRAFSLDDLDDYEKHFTVMNYAPGVTLKQVSKQSKIFPYQSKIFPYLCAVRVSFSAFFCDYSPIPYFVPSKQFNCSKYPNQIFFPDVLLSGPLII